jgi:hypothetical protein
VTMRDGATVFFNFFVLFAKIYPHLRVDRDTSRTSEECELRIGAVLADAVIW